MVSRNEGLRYNIGHGYSEQDAEAPRRRLDGYAVISGLKVSTDGTNLTLDVSSGSATVGQTNGSVDTVSLASAGTVTLDDADTDDPRFDTVYIDESGTLDSETGVAEPVDPSGNTRFNVFQPEPPEPSREGAILAHVWVAAGTSSIASADIRDRRQPSEWVGDTVTAQSVGADELNSVHILDPDATDWGKAVNDAISGMESRDVLYVPPVDYDHSTKAVIDKNITLTGHAPVNGVLGSSRPRIDRSGNDVPFLETGDNVLFAIEGLSFRGDDSGTKDGIICHGATAAKQVAGTFLGTGSLFDLHLETSGDNLNNSELRQIGGRQLDNVVRIRDSVGDANTNSIIVEVVSAFNCRSSGIDLQDGSGCRLTINTFEGSTSPTGGIILGDSRNKAFVGRVETSAPGVVFDNSTNLGVVGYNVTGDDFTFNNNNNRAINLYSDANWLRVASAFGGIELDTEVKLQKVLSVDNASHPLELDTSGDIAKARAVGFNDSNGGAGATTNGDGGYVFVDDGTNFGAGDLCFKDKNGTVHQIIDISA